MAFIQKQDKTPKVPMTFKIDERIAAEFSDYCEYLDSDPSYVVAELMTLAFRKDKEFQAVQESKKQETPAAPVKLQPKKPRKPREPKQAAEMAS